MTLWRLLWTPPWLGWLLIFNSVRISESFSAFGHCIVFLPTGYSWILCHLTHGWWVVSTGAWSTVVYLRWYQTHLKRLIYVEVPFSYKTVYINNIVRICTFHDKGKVSSYRSTYLTLPCDLWWVSIWNDNGKKNWNVKATYFTLFSLFFSFLDLHENQIVYILHENTTHENLYCFCAYSRY